MSDTLPRRNEVTIGTTGLPGYLTVPADAKGLVVFVHGSGSGRFSPRNRHVAEALNKHGLATLLFDLLTDEEAEDRRNVFDIPLLAGRVMKVVRWSHCAAETRGLPVGLFGASTGAAAALVAAANLPAEVASIVSRGGRPDMANEALPFVRAPSLLIVGGEDRQVLNLNRAALEKLECTKRLDIVPGATHLFEEPGALDAVVELAKNWFMEHFVKEAG